jgi:N-alpha-acetyltransferase 40
VLGKPVAFVMLYFNAEEEPETTTVTAPRGPRVQQDRFSVYCMELQVSPAYQSSGIGRRIMQLMELVGAKAGCEVALLTVLKPNVRARKFYTERLKYAVDVSSPEHVDPENVSEYEFVCLGKALPKRK